MLISLRGGIRVLARIWRSRPTLEVGSDFCGVFLVDTTLPDPCTLLSRRLESSSLSPPYCAAFFYFFGSSCVCVVCAFYSGIVQFNNDRGLYLAAEALGFLPSLA